MKRYTDIKLLAVLFAVMTLLTGCAMMEDDYPIEETTPQKVKSYISLRIALPSSDGTRATTPTGGEEGDGRENGQTYENTVSSAVVFIYQDAKAINGSEDTPVTVLTFGGTGDTYEVEEYNQGGYEYKTQAREVELEMNVNYNVLAVMNHEGCTDENGNAIAWSDMTTLGKVRDAIVKNAWTKTTDGTTTSYSNFMMSTENCNPTDRNGNTNAILNVNASTSEENPAIVNVEVERLAARIDYYAPGADADGTARTDGKYILANGDEVKILGAMIVNDLNGGTYLMKRVAGDVSGTVNYLGDETENGGVQTNYVIDPWTSYKTLAATNLNGKEFTKVYNNYFANMAYNTAEQWSAAVPNSTEHDIITDEDNIPWNRIGYTMENTHPNTTDLKHKYYTTVVFKAEYTIKNTTAQTAPKKPRKTTVNGLTVEDAVKMGYCGNQFQYENGDIIFKWNDVYYASAHDLFAACYPSYNNYNPIDNLYSNIIWCTGWENFKSTALDVLKTNNTSGKDDPTGYYQYLLKEYENNKSNPTYTASEMYKWSTYMKNTFGYELNTTTGEVIISQDGMNKLTAFDVTTWRVVNGTLTELSTSTGSGEGGSGSGGDTDGDGDGDNTGEEEETTTVIRYYTWRVLHSKKADGQPTPGVMEYGIVRNNIYKLTITKISEPGDDTPEYDDPSGEEIQVHTVVKNWEKQYEEDITM